MKPLLLCGASVRSLAQSAVRAGWTPWCLDFFADTDLRQLLSACGGQLLEPISSFEQIPARIAAVPSEIPVLWCGGLENHPGVLQELHAQRTVFGAHPSAVCKARDLQTLHPSLMKVGVRCPITIWVDGETDQLTAEGEWLRKSRCSSGGMGVMPVVRTANGLKGMVSATHCLQQRIVGSPLSALLIADAGTGTVSLIGCCLQFNGLTSLHAVDFQYCGNLGPVSVDADLTSQILLAARSVVRLTGLAGAFGMDFIVKEGQAWLLEINPRLTASHEIYELTSEPGLFDQHLSSSRSDRTERRVAETKFPSAVRQTMTADRRYHTVLRLIVYQSRGFGSSWAIPRDTRITMALPSGNSAGADIWLADLPSPASPDSQLSAASIAVEPESGGPLCSVFVGIHRAAGENQRAPSSCEHSPGHQNVTDGLSTQLDSILPTAAALLGPLGIRGNDVAADLREHILKWHGHRSGCHELSGA